MANPVRIFLHHVVGAVLLTGVTFGLAACDVTSGIDNSNDDGFDVSCSLDESRLVDGGVGRDGIPALDNPALVAASEASYLADTDRVIGVLVDGEPYAIPHNILWWHEIVNVDAQGTPLAITYCPLTGSSMAFDRAAVDGATLGVSGLLFNNNLTMFDRRSNESLWPQMNRQASCGPADGTELAMHPVFEMTWAGWQSLHPDTEVLSNNTGFDRVYTANGYPYGDYEEIDNDRLLFSMPIDDTRPPKERLLGLPAGEGGTAFPFGELDTGAPFTVVEHTHQGEPVVIFWDAERRGAMAFRARTNGEPVRFAVEDRRIRDEATGSTWTVDGRAVEGPRAGTQLDPIADAYVAFWFAWAEFQPDTDLWTANQ